MSEQSEQVAPAFEIPAESSALIVVDMQNGFCHPKGAVARSSVVAKAFSTPPDFSRGIISALELGAAERGLSLGEIVDSMWLFLHSTTVAENAIADGAFARAGLITTSGFRDTLFATRGGFGRWSGLSDDEKRNPIETAKPPPLVPRARIRTVRERVDRAGGVVVALDEEETARVVTDRRAGADPVGEFVIRETDAFYAHYMGGGGYGDPLARDPDRVAADIRSGTVSVDAARAIYGVVLNAGGNPDVAATRARRLELRGLRLGGDVPEFVAERATVRRTPLRINAYLQSTDDGAQCTWCGSLVAVAGTPWKLAALRRDRTAVEIGQPSAWIDGLVLRQYFCPTCATLLDSDVALVDDPALHDEIERWPTEEPVR
jgi:hypothetical protein